jgi:RND family efflux transporter MFP subunit
MNSKNPWKRGRALLLATTLLAVPACSRHQPSDSPAAGAVLEARTEPAELTEVPRFVDLHGTVEATKTAAISARVMAMVTGVRVATGDTVTAGQPLVDLDPQVSEGQLSQARGALAQARAALTLAESNLGRFEALADAEAASTLELETARMQYEQAKGAVEQAGGSVAAASSVAADSRVKAPFAGRVLRKMVEVGDLAAPGRPLLLLESGSERRLVLEVPESVMAQSRLSIGDSLEVRLDSYPDLGTLRAAVVEATPGADVGSHSFRVKVELPAADIASGASGRARIEIGRSAAVTVPEAALLTRGGLSLVVVLDTEGRAGSRVVTVGSAVEGNRVEILSGLVGGEVVAVGLAAVPSSGTRIVETEARGG